MNANVCTHSHDTSSHELASTNKRPRIRLFRRARTYTRSLASVTSVQCSHVWRFVSPATYFVSLRAHVSNTLAHTCVQHRRGCYITHKHTHTYTHTRTHIMHTHTHAHAHPLSIPLSLSLPPPPSLLPRIHAYTLPPHTITVIPARVRAPCVCVCVCAHTHVLAHSLTYSLNHARTHALKTDSRRYTMAAKSTHTHNPYTHIHRLCQPLTHTHSPHHVIHSLTLTHLTMAAKCTHTHTHTQSLSFSYTHSPRQDSHRHPWQTRASCREGHTSDQLCFRARSRARRSLAPGVQDPPCPSRTFRCQFSSV